MHDPNMPTLAPTRQSARVQGVRESDSREKRMTDIQGWIVIALLVIVVFSQWYTAGRR
jgi:hypothetical protein